MKTDRSYHNFSLIELLVVVAIIGILTSMLLPSLQKARNEAKRAVCLNNQKQCGIALISYSIDYTSIMARDLLNGGVRSFWSGFLADLDYIGGDAKTYRCPSFPPDNGDSVALTFGINIYSQTGENNVKDDIQDKIGNSRYYISHNRIVTPTEFVLLVDSTNGTGVTQAHFAQGSGIGHSGPHVRHNKKANTLFMDGHAKAQNHTTLISLGFIHGRLEDGTSW